MALQRAEIWRSMAVRGEPTRADARLRTFARREGHAVFCRQCDGDGLILCTTHRLTSEPFRKCPRCGGEGLEPME